MENTYTLQFGLTVRVDITGAMGKPNDPNAVVDSRGRVFGVHGLRVIDASAFPLLPPGHIQSSVCKFVS